MPTLEKYTTAELPEDADERSVRLDEASRLLSQEALKTLTPDEIRRSFEGSTRMLLVTNEKKRLVGAGVLRLFAGGGANIPAVGVAPELQGQGIGTELI